MAQTNHMAFKAHARSAADWVARLSGEPVEADWLAFEAWLSADAGHRPAYDRALVLSLSIDSQASSLADRVETVARRPARTSQTARHAYWGAALMSVAAVAVTFAVLQPRPEPKAEVYATAKGERRDIVLSDGTRVALNAASSLSVVMKRDRRELTLASGEAAFKVVHDPTRPFVVHLGDRDLRDVGTEFDASRQGGMIRVTVREGMVAVLRHGADRSLSLGPGGRLEHKEGSLDTVVEAANPDDAFSWRTGRLIYRGRPLSEVAADLNRYGGDEVRVTGAAANLKFTGVLAIGDQPSMVRHLTDLLPVTASPPRKDGVILLSELNSSK
jgi:transmembrane sensor